MTGGQRSGDAGYFMDRRSWRTPRHRCAGSAGSFSDRCCAQIPFDDIEDVAAAAAAHDSEYVLAAAAYARALARFSCDDLEREVSRATGRSGNALYQMVAGQAGALEEARFVDQVSRNLAAGRFLLMVVGDGITEGTQRIGEYLIAQPGLAFDFALVEMAQYVWKDESGCEHTIVQPRLLAKTAVIERAVIRNEAQVIIEDLRDEPPAPSAGEGEKGGRKLDPALQQQWRAFAEKFIASVTFDDP